MELLTGEVQAYAWGSTTRIPELLGTQPTGEPQAELWLGAHPSAPSLLDGRPLDEVIAADPTGVLGDRSVSMFGPRLPFLLKVLAAARPLSLQAHPSRAEAEAGYAREQAAGVPLDAPTRIYKDDWPKPEVLCALFDSEALCGFRDPAETLALFERLGVASALDLVRPLSDTGRRPEDRLTEVFGRLLRLAPGERTVLDQVLAAASAVSGDDLPGDDVPGDDVPADQDLRLFARTAIELHEASPGDPGVLAALLMNRVAMHPGDAVFLPAGNLHAYLHGGGVEIMANSDNVMRGGLTPKHVDVDELLSVLDFRPGFAGFVEPVEEADGVWRYPTPAPEFALWRIEAGTPGIAVPGDGGRIVIVTQGSVRLSAGDHRLDVSRGQSAFLQAGDRATVQGLDGSATLFVGAPGLD